MTEQSTRISLYREWRPARFSEVVGQVAIVQTLLNAVKKGHVAHAYLFSGERGIGKTTAARILSRAVNCLEPVEGEPCNTCANCATIAANRTLDIVEIDGASNRGIDHIRQLREEVNFAPTDLLRKVYIIDEVHMLTNEAFNALLKTLEEPPPHAMFIFATTEPHKVPRTIISRCQAFEFRRISPDDIAGHLQSIAEAKSVSIDAGALELISHRANGGMRDALVMLEQAMSYGGAAITKETILDMLGLADRSAHEAFLSAVDRGDQHAVMQLIEQLLDQGKDIEIFLADVTQLLRERLMSQTERDARLIQLAQGLLQLKADLFRSLDRRIRLEVGVLALMASLGGQASADTPSQPEANQTPTAVQQSAVATPPKEIQSTVAPKASEPRVTTTDPIPEAVAASSEKERMVEEVPLGNVAPPASTAPGSSALSGTHQSAWDAMMSEIQQDRIAIAAFIVEGAPTVVDDRLVISFHPEHSFHKASLEMRDNLQYLAGVVRRHFGDSLHVEVTTDESVSRKPLPHEVLMEKAKMVCEAVEGKIVKEDW